MLNTEKESGRNVFCNGQLNNQAPTKDLRLPQKYMALEWFTGCACVPRETSIGSTANTSVTHIGGKRRPLVDAWVLVMCST